MLVSGEDAIKMIPSILTYILRNVKSTDGGRTSFSAESFGYIAVKFFQVIEGMLMVKYAYGLFA